MELKPIRSKQDYKLALAEAERLWDVPDKSPAADQLDVLARRIENYERQHYPIADLGPSEFPGK